jgi:glycosyltransferase involved in cell wall biosynthesis
VVSRVTIIIPTFNRARLVPRAIDSVLAQSQACNLIVVDDGSTDNTGDVLRRYRREASYRLIRHPRNRGQAAARNTGIANIPEASPYFGILDSDDTLEPDAVAILMEVFERAPDQYSQVFGWCQDMHTGENTGSMPMREGLVTYDHALSGQIQGEFWQLSRRDILGEMRFEERARGGAAGVWWRMLRDRPGWLVANTVRQYDRSGSDRVSIRGYTADAARWTMWACKAGLVAPLGPEMRERYPVHYSALSMELAKWAALAGNGREARAAAREAIRTAPTLRSVLVGALAHLPGPIVRRTLTTKREVLRRTAN